MEILSFRISGKMGHFRKYYANNTAFSFSIPPRTTIMGMVAAAMGWPKDGYYEDLASEKIQFGIRVLQPVKKNFHRLNLLSIKSLGDMAKNWSSDFRGENGPVQTPFEIITPWDITKGEIVYEIYLTAKEDGKSTYDAIKTHFSEKEPVYNLTLGTANFTARLSHVHVYNASEIEARQTDEYVFMNSALPVKLVSDLKFDKDQFENYNFIEEDMLPGDFMGNGNREVRKMNRLLFSITSNPLRVKLNQPYFTLTKGKEVLNIQFMDA